MKIKCPNCGNVTTWEENKYKPFCSERCKLLDPGAWADEKFKVGDNINSSGINLCLASENDE